MEPWRQTARAVHDGLWVSSIFVIGAWVISMPSGWWGGGEGVTANRQQMR